MSNHTEARDTARYLLASAIFSLLVAATVIVLGGYYESPTLLLMQIVLIAGPTFLPFLALPKEGRFVVACWVLIAAMLMAGWSYVVYVDTRPYTGGGASFAVLFGWFTCLVAVMIAVILLLFSQFGRR
jgi:hypothetical protein